MLDYEHYRENYEIDVELRATDIYLRSFGGSSEAVQGSATAQQGSSLWARWRAPSGWHALDRPVRYVLEKKKKKKLPIRTISGGGGGGGGQRGRARIQRPDVIGCGT